MPPDWTANVSGLSLASVGLDEALILWPDGAVTPVYGFVMLPGRTIVESLLARFAHCIVYADEDALISDIPLRLH